MTWYPSKIDWWLGIALCIAPLVLAWSAIDLWQQDRTAEVSQLGYAALIVVGVYGGLIFPMRYGLSDTDLTIRFGQCRRRIPFSEITEAFPTRNPLSSPALSLDRIHIQHGQGIFRSVRISPVRQQEFLTELAERAGLEQDGSRVFRPSVAERRR